jgi:hypothetical protein
MRFYDYYLKCGRTLHAGYFFFVGVEPSRMSFRFGHHTCDTVFEDETASWRRLIPTA